MGKSQKKIAFYVALCILLIMTLGNTKVFATGDMDVWTTSSYENIFRTQQMPSDAMTSIDLVVVKNEFESAQVLLRSTSDFGINSVTFSDLSNGNDIITADNLRYNFIEYITLTENSKGSWQHLLAEPTTSNPIDFPDILSNEPTISVNANETQPIWITTYIPKNTTQGTYHGTITISTTLGSTTVPISLEVYDVTIPDTADSEFDIIFWQQLTEIWNRSEDDLFSNNAYATQYDVERWTPEWWEIMDKMAIIMNEHRHNTLFVSVPSLLAQAGSYFNSPTDYHFDWSKFDQFIQLFKDRGVNKVWGANLTQPSSGNAFIIVPDGNGGYKSVIEGHYLDSHVQDYFDALIPELVAHLNEKGWLDNWLQSCSDEPGTAAKQAVYRHMKARWKAADPNIKVGDAYWKSSVIDFMVDEDVDYHVPVLSIIRDDTLAKFDSELNKGKRLYLYTMGSAPQKGHLNRELDLPVWNPRLIPWFAYKNGASGYLHYAWNVWRNLKGSELVDPAKFKYKADRNTVHPDYANKTVKLSMRYENDRDGAEDYELFKILEAIDKEAANDLVNSVIQSKDNYVRDISYMMEQRKLLVKYAAGESNEPPQGEVENVEVETNVGIEPILPSTVNVSFNNEGNEERNVTWDTIPEELYNAPGTFTVVGDVEGTSSDTIAYVTVIDTLITLDDTSSELTYGGVWEDINHANDYNGTLKRSNAQNNYIELTFTGTFIEIVGRVQRLGGIAEIYLDDVLVDTIDQYHRPRLYQETIFSQDNLESGQHTIKIVVTGENNPDADGNYIYFDYIKYQ